MLGAFRCSERLLRNPRRLEREFWNTKKAPTHLNRNREWTPEVRRLSGEHRRA